MYEYRHAIYGNISTFVSLLLVKICNKNQPFSCSYNIHYYRASWFATAENRFTDLIVSYDCRCVVLCFI